MQFTLCSKTTETISEKGRGGAREYCSTPSYDWYAHVVYTQLNIQLIYISLLHNTDSHIAASDFETTTFPRFSGIPTSPFRKFTGSPQEYKYISGWKHQNCSTTRTGLRATPHEVKGTEGNKAAASVIVCQHRKENTKKCFFFF